MDGNARLSMAGDCKKIAKQVLQVCSVVSETAAESGIGVLRLRRRDAA
jgi:hypothetical protein